MLPALAMAVCHKPWQHLWSTPHACDLCLLLSVRMQETLLLLPPACRMQQLKRPLLQAAELYQHCLSVHGCLLCALTSGRQVRLGRGIDCDSFQWKATGHG